MKTTPKKLEYIREWRLKNLDKARKYSRDWHNRNKKQVHDIYERWSKSDSGIKYREKDKENIKARAALRYQVRAGKIKRQPCGVCGKPNAQGHHEDYSKPLEVKWLCPRHHSEQHN